MPIDPELLSILCCPKTKVPVQPMTDAQLGQLNSEIHSGGVQAVGGESVAQPFGEGLITEDGATAYRIDDGIPIMLIDEGINVSQIVTAESH